jgi:hypothetical protein
MISGVGSYQDSAFGEDLSSTTPADGGRQWAYQGCTTFGFWDAQGMSLYIPSAAMCKDLFGDSAPYADSTIYNQKYNAPFLTDSATAPSNILFTYGSEDVWTKLGLVQQTNHNPKIVIKTIEGAGHHFDLNLPSDDDTDEVKAARDVFIAQARTWLK